MSLNCPIYCSKINTDLTQYKSFTGKGRRGHPRRRSSRGLKTDGPNLEPDSARDAKVCVPARVGRVAGVAAPATRELAAAVAANSNGQ